MHSIQKQKGQKGARNLEMFMGPLAVDHVYF